jgi:ABC-type lipoprotein export system ATPase subunit
LIERLGLSEHANRLPSEISVGQQQRTALARALVLEPAILLADEPTSHQDAGWRDSVWDLLLEAATAGTTCVVATHEDGVAEYAATIWRVDDGAVHQQ